MLIGRQAEIDEIDGLLESARAGRSGALVFRGDPGVGKTALLRHAVGRAESMLVLRATGFESEAELEFSGLVEVCRPLLGRLDALPPAQSEALSSALGIGDPGGHDRFVVAAATLGLIAAAAEVSPVLVVVDDAHWLDVPSVDALLFVARRLSVDRVAFILATRPEGLASTGLPEIRLRGLDDVAAAALLADVVGSPLAPQTAAALIRTTGGNPLGLVELPRHLSEAQLAGRDPLTGPLLGGDAIRHAFAETLNRLADEERSALVILAAADDSNLDPVLAAWTEIGVDPAILGGLEGASIVQVVGNRVFFTHPLLRSASFASGTTAEQRAAHRALAHAMGDNDLDRRAWHLAQAALGPDEEAAEALQAAALRARARSGWEAAGRAAERSARLTADQSLRAERLADAAQDAWQGGDVARAQALVTEAVPLVRDQRTRAELVRLQGQIELRGGTSGRAKELFVESAELFLPDDPVSASRTLTFGAMASHHGAAVNEAVVLARRARQLLETTDSPESVFAEYILGRALVASGSYRAGVELLELAIDAFDREHEPSSRILTSISLGSVVTDRDEEARRSAEQALRAARGEGPIRVAEALTLVAETDVRVGEWERALAAVDEGTALAHAVGQANIAAYLLMSRVRVEAARGNEGSCREHADEVLPHLRSSGLVLPEFLVEHSLGILELGLDRLDDAVEKLERVATMIEDHGLVGRDFIVEADLVECLLRRGDGGSAAARVGAWQERLGGDAPRSIIALVRRSQGLLAEDFDPPFVEALAIHDTLVAPFAEARTKLCYGERLRRAGRRVDARVQLREALRTFERLGAEVWIRRCRRELRATGEKLGRRDAVTGEELTPHELQIALQVAEGRTNREVAAAMFLSPKTIEFHLSRIYRKLDISSRSALVRRFARTSI